MIMASKNGLFKNIKEKKNYGTSKYIRPGTYTLEIDSVLLKDTKNGEQFLIVGFRVQNCKGDHKEGEYVTHFFKQNHYFLNNVKKFIAAAIGCDFDAVDEELAEAVIGPSQPLKGKSILCFAHDVKTKMGHLFTVCEWGHSGIDIGPAVIKKAHHKHMKSVKGAGKNKKKAKKETKEMSKKANFGMSGGYKKAVAEFYPDPEPPKAPKEEKKPAQTKFERKIML